jgi:hypothetical protein
MDSLVKIKSERDQKMNGPISKRPIPHLELEMNIAVGKFFTDHLRPKNQTRKKAMGLPLQGLWEAEFLRGGFENTGGESCRMHRIEEDYRAVEYGTRHACQSIKREKHSQ